MVLVKDSVLKIVRRPEMKRRFISKLEIEELKMSEMKHPRMSLTKLCSFTAKYISPSTAVRSKLAVLTFYVYFHN